MINLNNLTERCNMFKTDDIVEYVPNSKYPNYYQFKGQGIITSADIVANKYVWVDWHVGCGMVLKSELKLSKDQNKVIYSNK